MSNAVYLLIIAVLLAILFVLNREEKYSKPIQRYHVEQFWQGPERREFKRVSTSLQIDYYYLSSDGKEFSKKEGIVRTTSTNVSWGGLQLLLPEKLKEKTRLALEIQLEPNRSPIRAVGEVVWMEEATDNPQPDGIRLFRTGVKLVGFTSEAQDRLVKFLYEEAPS